MAEYIEREAFVKYIRSREGNFIDDMGKGWSNGMDAAASMCEKFPAADVAPVVRCKECKHYQKDMLFGNAYCDGRQIKPDDFCSYGERRDTDV